MKDVLIDLVGYPQTDKEEYIKRSAYFWAEEIKVPLLILHGEDDARVKVSHAKKFSDKLKEYGKEYELHIYPGDDHGLSKNRRIVEAEIFKWFSSHLNN